MKKTRLLISTLAIALLAMPTLVVFAKELSSLRITGPGIKGELNLSDPKDMDKFMNSNFFDTNALGKKPSVELGTPYTISSYLNMDGKIVPFVQMDYYPAEPGTAGYVHYTGRGEANGLRKVDEWGIFPLEGDEAFREVLAAHGVTVQAAIAAAAAVEVPAEPAVVQPAPVAPVTSRAPAEPSLQWLLIAIAAVIVLAAAGLALRRRVVAH